MPDRIWRRSLNFWGRRYRTSCGFLRPYKKLLCLRDPHPHHKIPDRFSCLVFIDLRRKDEHVWEWNRTIWIKKGRNSIENIEMGILLCRPVDFYMIPCINYAGNFWGEGKEPKGMYRDGENAASYTGFPSPWSVPHRPPQDCPPLQIVP